MKSLILVIFLLAIFFSCKDGKEDIIQLVDKWQGKEIYFPKKPIFTIYATDTINYKIPQSKYKVLVYIDSIGCFSCKLQLAKWKELIKYTDSLTNKKIPFLFFFNTKDSKKVKHLLRQYKFDLPVCIDYHDLLNKQNKFPQNMEFQTFLLDNNNKVKIIGNPVHNIATKDLYLKYITEKDNSIIKKSTTSAYIAKNIIDLGIIKKDKIKELSIEIKNIGDNPLVIIDIATTCGCTSITYKKQPIKPEESFKIKIKIHPQNKGLFNESVTIKYNSINNQPIKVKIKGNVLL